ncbi:MAG: aminotransferase class III-fold pyridoxal phosphate-dependent enzyme [Xenococcaceae cyanobacterium]
MDREPIAIIGIGCRFPKAKNKEAFWQLLKHGVDGITEIPESRWDAESFYHPDIATPNKMNTRWGGFLEQIDQFDPHFFKISPREAPSIDPQQRLLLEVAWEAIEDAGQKPEHLAGTPTGVFIGIASFDYYERLIENPLNVDAYTGTGNTNSIAANRISYTFNLTGPSIAIDTACSSSLVAIHLACQSLWSGESTLTLAGGVQVLLSPWITVSFSKAGFMAPDGRCKTFDSRANGYVRSEGAGVVVLKPLSQALADGDSIYALIRGSAVNQDGRSNGLTAPNPRAQEAVLRSAYRQAGVSPGKVQYIEAHAIGTKLGDPIEMKALGKVLSEERSPGEYCAVGSVKTNIGHTEAAAGIAGLIKVALSLKHQQIPPNLHFQQPNPYIPFDKLPLRVQQTLEPWPKSVGPALAGISSFSFGGTNSHVVLEEAPVQTPATNKIERKVHLLTLGAKSEEALRELAQRYQAYLQSHSEASLADVCFTANTGRSHFDHRLAITTESTTQLSTQLKAFAVQNSADGVLSGKLQSRKSPKIAFLFTDQGSYYLNMGKQLYNTQPTFRKALEQCDELLRPHLDRPLLSVLYSETEENGLLLNQATYLQPALFALEYSLAQLWQSWGIVPDIVMGHSIGEYPAACVAGAFSLEEGLKLIAQRGRLMQQLPNGGQMAVVFAPQERVAAALIPYQGQIAIAAINGPKNTVISGESKAVSKVLHQLESENLTTHSLQVSHAFHSPLIEPILDEFEQIAAQVKFHPPRLPIVSTLTGNKLEPQQILDAQYWRRHTREPVQFFPAINTLVKEGRDCFLELGPNSTLIGMGKRCCPKSIAIWLSSLKKEEDDWKVILSSLTHLYLKGVDIDWSGFDRDYQRQKLHLPTYPFQRKHYWINPPKTMDVKESTTQMSQPQVIQTPKISQPEQIESTLQTILAKLLQTEPAQIDIHINFLDIGANSIVLIEALRKIEDTFGIQLSIAELFEKFPTIDSLATHISQNLPPDFSFTDSADSEPQVESTNSVASVDTREQEVLDRERVQSVPSGEQGAGNREQGAGSREQGAGSREQGAGSREQGAGSREQGALPVQHTSVQPQKRQNNQESSTSLERIVAQQLDLMSQQLELLRNNYLSPDNTKKSVPVNNAHPERKKKSSLLKTAPPKSSTPPAPHPTIPTRQSVNLNSHQQKHLEALIERYTQQTRKSKQRAQYYRPVIAHKKASTDFWLWTKEMLYPIVAEKSLGARFWDVDGNEYVDITMGFGVHLFGHQAPFITEALEDQLKQGIQVEPQSKFTGQVAELVTELTDMERVTFCNSGTEAVMTALRLARATTGRLKIAIFADSYHGHFDGTLAMSQTVDGKLRSVPLVTGVSPKIADDVLVLTYGKPQSLEIIKAHADELAAVLVEPVQSCRLDLQPREFLQQLRKLTQEKAIALIFDEVLTGFRVHPGGAQGWFGVKADLATYGKVLGGGLPIGAVAGAANYIDRIDGGMWLYGDDSYPEVETTFFSGTFSQHPLTMATARAVLKHLKGEGVALQQQLNQRTSQLATTLNAYFEQESVPIKVVNFSSIFRFTFSGNASEVYVPIDLELLFYHLIEKGVYIWEGRTCFLSTAHTEEDINYAIEAVKDSVKELRAGGFLDSESLVSGSVPRTKANYDRQL